MLKKKLYKVKHDMDFLKIFQASVYKNKIVIEWWKSKLYIVKDKIKINTNKYVTIYKNRIYSINRLRSEFSHVSVIKCFVDWSSNDLLFPFHSHLWKKHVFLIENIFIKTKSFLATFYMYNICWGYFYKSGNLTLIIVANLVHS